MSDCHRFNKDDTPIKNSGGAGRPQSNKEGPEGAKLVQLMHTEIKQVMRKHQHKDRKCLTCEVEGESNSDDSTGRDGSDSTGKAHICKKRKLNSSFKNLHLPQFE